MDINMTISRDNENSHHNLMSFHTCMTFILQHNLKSVLTVFFNTVEVSGVQNDTGPHWLSFYGQK